MFLLHQQPYRLSESMGIFKGESTSERDVYRSKM